MELKLSCLNKETDPHYGNLNEIPEQEPRIPLVLSRGWRNGLWELL